jgi:enamine deaminase RidA (YjgF/YER057c/UK114 family)
MNFAVLSPSGVHPPTTYSHAVRVGDLVFVAGQVAKNPQNEIVGKGDPHAQTEQVFRNLQTVLEQAGSGLDLVAKLIVLATRRESLPAIAEVTRTVFGPVGHFPADTLTIVSGLAEPEFLVEIEAIAVVRDAVS